MLSFKKTLPQRPVQQFGQRWSKCHCWRSSRRREGTGRVFKKFPDSGRTSPAGFHHFGFRHISQQLHISYIQYVCMYIYMCIYIYIHFVSKGGLRAFRDFLSGGLCGWLKLVKDEWPCRLAACDILKTRVEL